MIVKQEGIKAPFGLELTQTQFSYLNSLNSNSKIHNSILKLSFTQNLQITCLG